MLLRIFWYPIIASNRKTLYRKHFFVRTRYVLQGRRRFPLMGSGNPSPGEANEERPAFLRAERGKLPVPSNVPIGGAGFHISGDGDVPSEPVSETVLLAHAAQADVLGGGPTPMTGTFL
jgi:hypothetical protein